MNRVLWLATVLRLLGVVVAVLLISNGLDRLDNGRRASGLFVLFGAWSWLSWCRDMADSAEKRDEA